MTGDLSPADGGSDVQPRAELRAAHADRDRVVEVLRVAAGDGRLTADELDQRLELALTARTLSELAVLTTDLPPAPAQAAGVLAQAKDLVRIDCGSGSARRDGEWAVPQRMEVNVTSGSVKLDFTRAVISQPRMELSANVKSGSLTLVTRPGIVINADDVAVNSGSVKVKAHSGPGAPVTLMIDVSGKVRSGSLKARPPRRTFLQWLLRRPAS